jgi:transcriptional regulator NrdR
MKCPYCGFGQDRVVDSRESKEADAIRRRRECERCNRRFTTYERIDEIPYMVVKKDGRRERFDRQKVLSGLLRACEKRPVPSSALESIVDAAETYLVDAPERELHPLCVGLPGLQGRARVQGRARRAPGRAQCGKSPETTSSDQLLAFLLLELNRSASTKGRG